MSHTPNEGPSRRRVLGGAAGLAAGTAVVAVGAPAGASAATRTSPDLARWRRQAAKVRITRDDWGIAHVTGPTDADAVFGMIYAQAEDDFNRVETNYLTNLGRLAEAEGESAIWQDLRQRLFIDPETLKWDYAKSPAWLRKLMRAWADGLNYYLATHPGVRPRALDRFEPWMALSFTEGSIGGDIERVTLSQLQAFYENRTVPMTDAERGLVFTEPSGSNGIAVAPSHTRDGHALLLINPHTSFYFRSELHMTSGEGLNAYGAATWGQFFVYQGFNPNTGWMHTSTGVDNVDEFAETIVANADGTKSYRYGEALRPVRTKNITISYRTDGGQAERTFTTYATHHGPIVREEDGKWVAFALMNKPIEALQQSFLRTKTRDYAEYIKVAEFKANSSNNTLFADSSGDIAFLTPQFMPIREDRFDYTKPVDGSDPATDWRGLYSLKKLPQAVNPHNGWAYNSNDAPWKAAGADSPKAADFPRYFDQAGENPRGPHVYRVMNARPRFTPQTLIDAAFDAYLTAFARLLPGLITAWDKLPQGGRKSKLAGQVALLRGWDYRWAADSNRDVPGRVLGRGPLGGLLRGGGDRGPLGVGLHGRPRHRRPAADRARHGDAAADGRFRRLAGALGEDQPLPARGRRHRPDVRRRQAEHPGAVHVGPVGFARLVRREGLPRDEALLRHQRQQLRRGRGVRPAAARLGGDGGRRERPPRLAALQRRGRTLRERQPAARLLLSGRPQGPHRTDVPAGRVTAGPA
jgi:acyl-homoserine-lactone acylase